MMAAPGDAARKAGVFGARRRAYTKDGGRVWVSLAGGQHCQQV